jgi:hypothetical protein
MSQPNRHQELLEKLPKFTYESKFGNIEMQDVFNDDELEGYILEGTTDAEIEEDFKELAWELNLDRCCEHQDLMRKLGIEEDEDEEEEETPEEDAQYQRQKEAADEFLATIFGVDKEGRPNVRLLDSPEEITPIKKQRVQEEQEVI